MFAQYPVGNVVEGPTPDIPGFLLNQDLDTTEHFPGGTVGEGNEHYPGRLHAVVNQPGQPIGQGPGLAASGARDDQHGSPAGSGNGELLLVKIGCKVDPVPGRS